MIKRLLFIALIFTTSLSLAQADDIGALVTDRPDATESPNLVRKGFLQIETGGFYTDNGDDNFRTKEITYNTTLLRYGLLENFELRIGLDYLSTEFESNGQQIGDRLNGTSPLLLGAKIGIAEENGWLPKMAILGHLSMPFTAGSDYKPENTGMDFRFAFDHTLSDRSGIAYNLGARLDAENPEIAYIYSISYGYDLTNKIGVYAELYGDFPEDSSANHFWDAGFTYLANDDLQFDLTFGSGITDGQNLLLSAGLSYRIKKN
jgi:hypothetical protein